MVKTWVARGRDDGQRQLLDVESVARHMLPAGSVFKRHALDPTILERVDL
jgi:hypothetical protein